jgi:iron-sulfur cluster assembly protein
MPKPVSENISATPAAVRHIEKMIAKRGSGAGMRLSVKNSGCSGKKYIVTLIDAAEIHSDDHIFPITSTLRICVDPVSFVTVAGTEVDYAKKGLNTCFIFNNPQEKASCGCGESFYV